MHSRTKRLLSAAGRGIEAAFPGAAGPEPRAPPRRAIRPAASSATGHPPRAACSPHPPRPARGASRHVEKDRRFPRKRKSGGFHVEMDPAPAPACAGAATEEPASGLNGGSDGPSLPASVPSPDAGSLTREVFGKTTKNRPPPGSLMPDSREWRVLGARASRPQRAEGPIDRPCGRDACIPGKRFPWRSPSRRGRASSWPRDGAPEESTPPACCGRDARAPRLMAGAWFRPCRAREVTP